MRSILLSVLLVLSFCSRAEDRTYGRYVHAGRVGHVLDLRADGTCTWSVTGCLGKTITECTWVENNGQLLILEKKVQQVASDDRTSVSMIAKCKNNKVKLTSTSGNGKWILWLEHPDVFTEITYDYAPTTSPSKYSH